MKFISKIIDIDGYKIITEWNNSEIRIVDLYDFVMSKSNNPDSTIAKLLDYEVFETVKCGNDTLYWNGLITYNDEFGNQHIGDLDLAPELLFDLSYKILKQAI